VTTAMEHMRQRRWVSQLDLKGARSVKLGSRTAPSKMWELTLHNKFCWAVSHSPAAARTGTKGTCTMEAITVLPVGQHGVRHHSLVGLGTAPQTQPVHNADVEFRPLHMPNSLATYSAGRTCLQLGELSKGRGRANTQRIVALSAQPKGTSASAVGLTAKMEMTRAALKEACRRDKLYTTPYLNDKLYLHYKVSSRCITLRYSRMS
jgi:hypothetical protein